MKEVKIYCVGILIACVLFLALYLIPGASGGRLEDKNILIQFIFFAAAIAFVGSIIRLLPYLSKFLQKLFLDDDDPEEM